MKDIVPIKNVEVYGLVISEETVYVIPLTNEKENSIMLEVFDL